jgi:DNA-directed RNA polymerase specialized sigma24 family protein
MSERPVLTLAQRRLFGNEPDLPGKAAAASVEAAGESVFRHLEFDELVGIATIAAMDATATWDPEGPAPYRAWAYFGALRAVLDNARWENRAHEKVRALLRASALVYFAGARTGVSMGIDTETSLAGKLDDFTNPVVGLAIAHVVTMERATGGEDEVIELETSALTGDALRELLPARGTLHRKVLHLHFVRGMSLSKVAAALGYEASAYVTFWRDFHALMAWFRDGLAARGIDKRPAWREEVSGRVLGDPADDP